MLTICLQNGSCTFFHEVQTILNHILKFSLKTAIIYPDHFSGILAILKCIDKIIFIILIIAVPTIQILHTFR